MTLSAAGCARLWHSAQETRPLPWEGRHRCLSCPIGAARAGRPGVGPFPPAELLREWVICPRSRRPATRLSRGHLINGRLCVSCSNRDREVLRGEDARGRPPRLVLRDVTLAVVESGAVRHALRYRVTSDLEAMLVEAMQAKGPLAFPCSAPPPVGDGWRPAPHACRRCRLQLVERAGTFRCPRCGGEGQGSPEAICGCGISFPETPLRGVRLFRCGLHLGRDLETTTGVVIGFGLGGGSDPTRSSAPKASVPLDPRLARQGHPRREAPRQPARVHRDHAARRLDQPHPDVVPRAGVGPRRSEQQALVGGFVMGNTP